MKLKKVLRIIKLVIEIVLTIIVIIGVIKLLTLAQEVSSTLSIYNQEAIKIVENSDVTTFRSQETSYIYDKNGTQIAKLKLDKDTEYVSYEEIPEIVINSFVTVEDKNFWQHHGIDYKGILRVCIDYVTSQGEEMHGASTITQQLARNIFLTQEVTLTRKVKEILIAQALEEKYTKKQLMEFYINSIYYGNGYYGIGSAAKGYFGKPIDKLNTSQVALLCGIPNNPSAYNPVANLERSLLRRDKILEDLYEDNYITLQEKEEAIEEEIKIIFSKTSEYSSFVSYAINCAVQYLMQQDNFEFKYNFENTADFNNYKELYNTAFESAKYKLYTGGYRITTSLDPDIQQKLQESVDSVLDFSSEIAENNVLALQGAATCVDNETGKVVAIVGQRTSIEGSLTSSLNRAYQSFRQPGSTIKPLVVYTPALERNYTANTIVDDSPIENGPANSGSYSGKITLRRAVELSKNVIAWKLLEEIGATNGLSYLQNMKFTKIVPDDYYLSAALGGLTHGVSTLEMATAYATLVNDGMYRDSTCITSFRKNGKELYVSEEPYQVYNKEASRAMIDILEGVITSGTANAIQWDSSKLPAAGKTGTTNDNKDGWFCGVTSYYSLAVWVGYDTPKTLNNLWGSTYPATIWRETMTYITKDKSYKNFNKVEIPEVSEVSEPVFGSEEWFLSHSDSEELSPGYSVGQYKKDLELSVQVDNIVSEIRNSDSQDIMLRGQVLQKYSEALGAINQIYGTTLKQENLQKLSDAYAEYQAGM